jgi:hypothetical protein
MRKEKNDIVNVVLMIAIFVTTLLILAAIAFEASNEKETITIKIIDKYKGDFFDGNRFHIVTENKTYYCGNSCEFMRINSTYTVEVQRFFNNTWIIKDAT